jgi:hypothetical protein
VHLSNAMKIAVAVLALGAFAGSSAARPMSRTARPSPMKASIDQLRFGDAVGCQPVAEGREELVHEQLASRIRGLSNGERLRLAVAILDEAEMACLDPLLILAVIQVESAYDAKARSSRGAHGLMQLRHATMRHELARSRLSPGNPRDQRDPILNVRAGVRYYRRLLKTFKSQDLALMAYNAGPNRISQYLRSGGVPDRFRTYPRRVRAEVKRLEKALTGEPRLAVVAVADDRVSLE